MNDTQWYSEIVTPALLRHARTAYGSAMRTALEKAGYEDIPGNGLYVIGALANGAEIAIGALAGEMRLSKQAAGQLVDTLVTRGYLTRTVDENDRRKLTIGLTPRGVDAAAVQAAGRASVDALLEARIGAADVLTMRRGLAALIEIHHSPDDSIG